MSRALRTFLSYRRLDAAEASELEREFGLRGLRLWRDVNDLPLGGATKAQIRRGIGPHSDAFVLYVTPRFFASSFIWSVEVPRAMARARKEERRGGLYPIVPVLRSVSHRMFRRRAKELGAARIADRNSESVEPLQAGAPLTRQARRLAFARVARRLLRSLLRRRRDAVTLTLRSFPAAAARRTLLDVDWSGVVDGSTPETWERRLIPALRDLQAELARAGRRRLAVNVQARLGLALAFGMVFSLASGFEVEVRSRGVTWPSRSARTSPLAVSERRARGRRGAAVIELSLTQDLQRSARRLVRSTRASRHVRIASPGGRRRGLRAAAPAIAAQVGDLARSLRADGVTDIHLVMAAPVPLALLLGRQLNAVGRIHSYYGKGAGVIRGFTFKT